MDKNFVYTCVECRLSDTIYKDTAQCKQGKFSDQLIVNRTQTALEVGSYQYLLETGHAPDGPHGGAIFVTEPCFEHI